MKTIAGINIFGEPKTLADKIAYMEIALQYLARNKGFTLHIDSCKEETNTICPYTYGMTCGDASFAFNISDVIFTDDPSFHSNEPHYADWPFEKRLILRLGRLFFEGYKDWQDKQNSISSITLGNATIQSDINVMGKSLTATFDELDDLKDRVEELKIEKQDLENQVKNLQSIVDLILNRCQDKGII